MNDAETFVFEERDILVVAVKAVGAGANAEADARRLMIANVENFIFLRFWKREWYGVW